MYNSKNKFYILELEDFKDLNISILLLLNYNIFSDEDRADDNNMNKDSPNINSTIRAISLK